MLPLCLCALLAAAPVSPVELRAGPTEPEDEVALEVTGLVAPARAEAGLYLFGRLATPAYSLRALLLRSTDGGAHWTEALPEVEHSEVLFVAFAGCEGRALVGWSTEGPGELTLYASPDCGATWKRRSTLPKTVWSEWPVHMAWKSGRQGTVWLRDMNEESSPLRVLTTRDGGRTWRAVKKPPQARPPAQSPESQLEARGPTGVRWEVTSDEQVTRVERQEQGAPARICALLPRYWRREGNMLVPAR
jgi:hypothetical protein